LVARAAAPAALFAEQGCIGPFRVLAAEQCEELAAALRTAAAPLDWEKGWAATSRTVYEVATMPAILDVVGELLGEDVLLWGASIQARRPGMVHSWHSDAETAHPDARTVSVWIGLEHTTPDSSLLLIPYSHRFGVTIQEERMAAGLERVGDDEAVELARRRDERSELVSPATTDGEALFFDGRLWHGSNNRTGEVRRALLLQYATPDTPIRVPDPNHFAWPFRELAVPKPPCVLVRGRDEPRLNRVVPAPADDACPGGREPRLTSVVYPLRVPLENGGRIWKPYHLFHGATPNVASLSCHASALAWNQTPHPPHGHDEEELLLLLAGEVELLLPDAENLPLYPGQLVYYPAGFRHTIRATSRWHANYLMLKWHGRADGSVAQAEIVDARDEHADAVFDVETASLSRLHCHVTTLGPGEGYEPHVDRHDVAVVVMDGEVETLGERVGPHGVVFTAGGEPHGLRNPGPNTATYLVVELHGRSVL
jgi:uncharacterized cupin superfamily protein